ncbi:uncharacterized protein LOC132269361 isoform X2 [Cornus florida]|uniref:uncharacterized protein LOC132269361 isoform X2 n=1 Tax=Cornus florida TaxID=4283 RepID=UPI00289D7359|nr:uncharacterized protein LOC132269361 isoform X2 [Cornus florida]
MALEAKNILVCLWRVLKGSMKLCYSCVKKCPFVSGILSSVIFLYIFLPTFFSFLVYSSPVLALTAVGVRVILSHRRSIKNVKDDDKKNDGISSQKLGIVEGDGIIYKHENSSAQSQTAIRRNVTERNKEVFEQGGVVEKGIVSSTTCNDDLVDKTALIEECPKDIREVKVDFVADRGESSSAASKRPKPENCGGSVERKFNAGGSEAEAESSEDDDEEEAQEDRNKAVEWNEDDQKNLMDLGISEIERNRRLESLIAKRRARKLLSMQIRRTLMNLGNNDPRDQIASILIPKSNHFHHSDSGDAPFSPMPGSAPSVLLPMHNPFDLPYEPHEEKPDLMGDSFHQEFMAAQQKEVMFCRHESFSLGAFFPGDLKQNRHETFWSSNFATRQRGPEIPGYSGLRNQLDSSQGETILRVRNARDIARLRGQTSERVSNLVDIDHEEDRNGTQTKRRLVKDDNGRSSSSSSSEANEPFFNANSEVLKSLSFSVPRNTPVHREDNNRTDELLFDSSPSAFDRIRMEERFFHSDKGPHHTPTHSIASDLQVEVSEVSSPMVMTDGSISPADRESLIAELEKETTSGSEKLWITSSYLSEAEEDESRSREVHEVSEQDIFDVGFLKINQKSNDPIMSHELPEKVVPQDATDKSPPSSSKTELPEGSKAHLTDSNHEIHDVVQPPRPSNSSDRQSSESLTLPVLEKAQQSMEKSLIHPSYEGDSERKPEEPPYPTEKSVWEANSICSMKYPAVSVNNRTEILGSIKDVDCEAPILSKQTEDLDLSVPTQEPDSKYIKIVEGKSEGPENHHSKSTSEYPGVSEKQTEHCHIAEKSILLENKNIQHRGDAQSVVEIGSSGANKNSNDPVALAVQPEVIVACGPIDSSSSSPEPVLEKKIPTNQVSSTNFDQTIQVTVQQFCDDMAEKNLLDELSAENFKPTLSQNALHLTEGSTVHHSDSTDPEKLQEPSNPPGNREANITRNVNDSERELTGVSHSLNDTIALAVLPELVVEQVPVASSSSSSPTSVLQKKLSMDQTSSLSFDQDIHIEDQQHETEMVENNYLVELPSENLASTAPQNALHLEGDSTAQPPNSRDTEKLQESSNISTMSTEEPNTIYIVNESVVIHNKGKDNSKSIEKFEGGSETLSSHDANAELSKTAERTDSRSNKDIESKSEELTICEASISPSKAAKQSDNSNIYLIKEEESFHPPPIRPIEEVTIISNLNESLASETDDKDLKSVAGDTEDDVGVKPKNLTEIKAVVDPSKLAEENGDLSNPMTSIQREEPFNPLPRRPIEEASIISSVNELVVSEMDENGYKSAVGDIEGESQKSISPETVVEPLESTEVASSRNMEDTKGKLSEVGAMVGSSDPAWENDNFKNKKDTKEFGKLTDHESVTKPTKPDQGNDSLQDEGRNGESIYFIKDSVESDKPVNHNVVMESSKPTESGEKVPNAEINKDHTKPDMVNDSIGDMEDRKGESIDSIKDNADSDKSVHHNGVMESSKLIESGGKVPNAEVNGGHTKPDMVSDSLRDMGDRKGESKDSVEDSFELDNSVNPNGVMELSKPTESGGKVPNAEVNRGHARSDMVNDSLGDMEDRKGESKDSVKDSFELDNSVNPNGVLESSKPTESGGKVPNAEVNRGHTKPDMVNDSLGDMEDRKGESKDSIKDSFELDNSVNHNGVMESSKPTESGGKVPNAEVNSVHTMPDMVNDSLGDMEDRKGDSKYLIKDRVELNKSVNHNGVMESLKPTESGGEVPNAEVNEGNTKPE